MPLDPNAPRARFSTEAEIIAAIDEKLDEVNRLRQSAAKLYSKAREHYKQLTLTNDVKFLVKRDKCLEIGDKKISKAEKIEKGYLTHLKRKLQQFRTELLPLPGLDTTDRSVTK